MSRIAASRLLPALILVAVSAVVGAVVAAASSDGPVGGAVTAGIDFLVAAGTIGAAAAAAYTARISARQAALAQPMLDAAQAQSEASAKLLDIEAQRLADERASLRPRIEIDYMPVISTPPEIEIRISNRGRRDIHVADVYLHAVGVSDQCTSVERLLEAGSTKFMLAPGQRHDLTLLVPAIEERLRSLGGDQDGEVDAAVAYIRVHDGEGNDFLSPALSWIDMHPEIFDHRD